MSRYVIGLALADDPERHPVALTPAEQAELRERVEEVWLLVRAAKEAAADSGLSLARCDPGSGGADPPEQAPRIESGAGWGRQVRLSRRRRARAKPQRHLSLSATDAEWAVVSANAERRGLSKARYLMGLVERDTGGTDSAPPMVLGPDEQRALLDAVRAIHALLIEDPVPSAREESQPADETAATPPPEDGSTPASPDTADPPGPPRQERLF